MTDIPDLSRRRHGDSDCNDWAQHWDKTPAGGGGGGTGGGGGSTTPEATFTLQYANPVVQPADRLQLHLQRRDRTGYNPPDRFGETIRGLLDAKFEVPHPRRALDLPPGRRDPPLRDRQGEPGGGLHRRALPANDPSKPAELLLVLNYDFNLADTSAVPRAAHSSPSRSSRGRRSARRSSTQGRAGGSRPARGGPAEPERWRHGRQRTRFVAYFQPATASTARAARGADRGERQPLTVELEPIISVFPNRDPISHTCSDRHALHPARGTAGHLRP